MSESFTTLFIVLISVLVGFALGFLSRYKEDQRRLLEAVLTLMGAVLIFVGHHTYFSYFMK